MPPCLQLLLSCNLLCRPDWPWSHSDLPDSTSQVLGLKACTSTTHHLSKVFFKLVFDRGGPSPLWHCGRGHPWPGGPDFIRKQGKQAVRSRPVSRTLPWPPASVPCSRFLPCLSACPDFLERWTVKWKRKLNIPFPLAVALIMVFMAVIVTLARTALLLHLFCN